ncbi:neurobeachin-like protein 1 isoform X2 [Bolinopsis microptera]|uniref:neurobeachin-like protein 1 isoform X2 n=1 Tax=Bolinopsis microptera TaxID=2820187 RepID=UPI003079BA56
MSGVQYVGSMTPEQESRTIQSAKLRATWQRFATSHQVGDIEATNASLDIHLKEMRSVYGFHHDTLQQSLTSSLSKQQEAQLNLKNHQNDLPKILAKELENQMSYLKEVFDSGGDATLPLSRAHGLILYLVILSRCSENIQPLSQAQLDVSISYAAVVTSQTLTKTCIAVVNNANLPVSNVNANQAVANWLQAILLEITCYYSFMCDRQNNWMNIVKSCKEETLLDALALDDPASIQAPVVVSNLSAHSVLNTTARGNFRIAINGIFNSKECKVKHKLLALDLLGTFLCGGESPHVILTEVCYNMSCLVSETACGIINDSTFTALLSLINTCPEHRDLVIQCVLIYIQQTHNSRPDKRQIDVRSLLSIYLQEISLKAKDEEYEMLSLYIELIPRILRVKDRPSLQSSFLGVFVFDKLFRVLSECNAREAVIISCIRAYSSLMRKSSSSKEEFEAHIGYLKMLDNITSPSLKIIQAILDMVVEGQHKAEFIVIQNLELLKVFLKWSFTMPGDSENEFLSYLLDKILDIITANMLSVMRCSSGGIITVITSFLSSPTRPLTSHLVEQLLAIVEKIGGYSISAIEVRQFILLFQVDYQIPNFTERLQVSLERMAKGKGAEGPNHFFDLQHQTAGITVPEIKVWPHGKNCYTFVCWFKLDLKSAGRRPMSPDTTLCEERYTLYSFYNANGYGFEGFFRPDGTLHIAVCNRKEFTTTSVDHNFLDNKWHFLGISHRGSPLLGMGEVCVRIDKKLTNKLQLASINCNQPFTSNTIGGAGLRQANSKDRRGSGNILTEFGSFISSKTTANKDVNVVTVTPGLQDEHYGIPTSLHGQLGPVALFWESLSPQELIDIHTVGLNNLALFQPHYSGPRKETLCDLSDKLILYYSAKASKEHVVLDLVANKTPAERLNGRLTGHNLSTWNIKDILACVGGVQLIFPLLESIGPVPEPANSSLHSQLKPVYLRSHYTSDSSVGIHEGKVEELGEDAIASGHASPAGFDVVQESGSIQSLPDEPEAQISNNDESHVEKTENRVARFVILLEEMLRDCPTNQESLLSTNGFAVISALLINTPPDELNMTLVKALQSLCLLLSYDVNPTNSSDEAYSPLLHDIYQHILFNFELWSKVDHEVRIAHIQYLSVIIKDNLQLCRRLYGVQFMLDAVRLYCSSNIEQPDTACVLRRAIFGFVKFYMRHGIQVTEVKSILAFIAVTPDLDQKLEAIELITVLVEVPPTSLPLARCLASQDAQDLLVGLLHTPCNELKSSLLKLVRTVVDTCCKNKIPLHSTQLCYVGEAVMACSIDGNPEIVNELLATVSIVVNSATELNQLPDVLLMQSLVQLLPRFGLTTRLHVVQELLVLTRTNLKLGEQYSLLPSWYNAVLCLMLGGSEEEGGLQEQLFVTIMELLHTILWRYYEKAGSLTKDQIGRILLAVDELESKIFKTTSVIKMRLFELIIHSMNLELKRSGYDGAITPDHTSLLELLEHFMFSKEGLEEEEEEEGDWSDLSCVKQWSSKLVQEILLFFNLLGVWDGKSDMELYRISLRVLLGCLHHHSYEYVSTAASKLHTLLDHPYFESYYTASYVLGALHFVIAPTLEDEVNQLHILLIPLVHTALTRWGTILGLDQSALDQLPGDEHSPDFMDDFSCSLIHMSGRALLVTRCIRQ